MTNPYCEVCKLSLTPGLAVEACANAVGEDCGRPVRSLVEWAWEHDYGVLPVGWFEGALSADAGCPVTIGEVAVIADEWDTIRAEANDDGSGRGCGHGQDSNDPQQYDRDHVCRGCIAAHSAGVC